MNVLYMPPFNTSSPLHICIIKFTFHVKHQIRSIQIFGMEKKAQTRDCFHTCVLLTFIGRYIYRRLIGLSITNREIQPFLLALRTKPKILPYREVVIMSTKRKINLQKVLHLEPDFFYKTRK